MFVRRMREEMRRRTHRWAVLIEHNDIAHTRVIAGRETRPTARADTPLTRMDKQFEDAIPPEHQLLAYRKDPSSERPGTPDIATLIDNLVYVGTVDPEAAAGIFPIEQCHAVDSAFLQAVTEAFRVVQSRLCRNSVVVLGRTPQADDGNSGWIEVKRSLLGCSGGLVRPVLRYWDNPPGETITDLAHRGCLQSTSVMIGRVDAFLRLIAQADPPLIRAMEGKGEASATAKLPATELCRHVLSLGAERLFVMTVGEMPSAALAATPLKQAASTSSN